MNLYFQKPPLAAGKDNTGVRGAGRYSVTKVAAVEETHSGLRNAVTLEPKDLLMN